jgi:hypothetical protein
MQNRFPFILFVCAFVAAGMIRAQPAAPALDMQPGLVLVAKVEGQVKLRVVGQPERDLKVDDTVPEKGTINTGNSSSVVLAFSNGATTRLGANTELILETFQMVPLEKQIQVKDLTEEPTRSRTRLKLNRGELVGDVKPLKINDGTGFVVETPVGAAGIRGTVFRIVFTPSGTGQAFFTLNTVSGNVVFQSPGTGGGAGSPGQSATGTGTVTGGLSIPTNQQIEFRVDVTTNAQGQMVVTVLPPPPSATQNIPPAVLQQYATTAKEIAVAVEKAVFAPTPAAAPGTGGGAPGTGTGTGSGGTTGSTTGSTTGGGTGSPTGTGGAGTAGQPGTTTTTTVTGNTSTGGSFTANVTTTPPPPTPPPPRITSP